MNFEKHIKWFAKADYVEFYDARTDKIMCIKYEGIDISLDNLLHNNRWTTDIEYALYDELLKWRYIK